MIGPSVTESVSLLASRRASAVELLEESLQSIAVVDPVLRAWETVDPASARAAARAADGRRSNGAALSAVDGVPIGVKDLIDTAGLRTTYGSPIYRDHIPQRDAHVVSRLRANGIVIVGKTVTTQFATFDPPPTRNPWNTAHTPGGSSAGSAASIASGMVSAALGTQTGGSIIRPASYCGVVGYVPSPGWIGRSGIYPCSWSLDRVGWLARQASDLPLVVGASTGRDRRDPVSRAVRLGLARRPGTYRIGVLPSLMERATDEMAAAVELVTSMKSVMADEIDIELDTAHAAHFTIMRSELASVHADQFAANREEYGHHIAALIAEGSGILAADYLRALRYRSRFRRNLARRLRYVDLIVAPAAVGPAEADLTTIGSPIMNLLAGFAGLPAVTVPVARSAAGLPLGVQVIGRPGRDVDLLAFAQQLEDEIRLGESPDVESVMRAPCRD